jgi:hypothetical protein
MTKRPKQSKRGTKSSKRANTPAQSDEETDTANTISPAEATQAAPTIPEAEVAVESQQPVTSVPVTPAIPQANVPKVPVESQQSDAVTTEAAESGIAHEATRSAAARANIKEGLKQHALAGRPTKAQLILVFGTKGYAMTWAQRTERYGIKPETFQAALA